MGRVCWEGERILALSMETGSGISTHSLISIRAHMQRTDTDTHHTSSIFKAIGYDRSNKKNCSHCMLSEEDSEIGILLVG